MGKYCVSPVVFPWLRLLPRGLDRPRTRNDRGHLTLKMDVFKTLAAAPTPRHNVARLEHLASVDCFRNKRTSLNTASRISKRKESCQEEEREKLWRTSVQGGEGDRKLAKTTTSFFSAFDNEVNPWEN